MVRIAIVGDPGSGGTTVLGLLYAAQVRRSSAEGSAFRFQAAPSSMPRVGAIFEQLKAGEFPTRTAASPSGPIEFLFEPRPTLAASLRGRWIPGRHPPEGGRNVQWTRASFTDLRRHLEGGGFPTDGARQLEGADVLAVLVPPTLNQGAVGSSDPGPDDTLAKAFSAADQQNRTGARSSMAVAFIFTMLDRLPEGRRTELGLLPSLQDSVPPERRETIGLQLVQELLPKTRALLARDGGADRSSETRPKFFFSWVETDPATAGRLRLRSYPGGGWEPAYPFGEYVALIEACDVWAGGRR
ncbi:MAG TPA: hypothetical protein VN842_01930 [Thermoplasmata archaeon]|nr:hypothetical protein [Thermoplasmata archaeon]